MQYLWAATWCIALASSPQLLCLFLLACALNVVVDVLFERQARRYEDSYSSDESAACQPSLRS